MAWHFPDWASVTGPAVNCLKGGAVTADRVVTVSAGFAWEVTTPEGGWGLDAVLRSRSAHLNGITNGIDVDEWNPASDPFTAVPYDASSVAGGKAACKAALQKELGLTVDPSIPLIGFIGRLTYQKSPDVVLGAVPALAAAGVQVVVLGSGDAQLEGDLRRAEAEFRSHFRGWAGFSVPVSHRITAGADILLMPSRFEPCGLNQLYAMR